MKSPVLLTVLILMFCAVLPGVAQAFDVETVRFGTYPDKTRMVIELSESKDFRAFVLADPARLVVDLPSFDWQAGNVPGKEKAGIKVVRHGNLQPGVSRIVFDLNRRIAIHDAFTLPAGSGKPPRLVVDFANTNASGFRAAQGKIHGSLNADGIQKASIVKPAPKPSPRVKGKKPLVIIDPGHGGIDPGAIGANGVHEKVVALNLAIELKKQLEKSGKYRVKMTRETDVFIKLRDRVKFARDHGGDLFVSIHADSLRDPGVSGASIYTLSEKASDAQTAKLAARENKADLIAGIDIEVEDEAVYDILLDIARRDTQNQSKYFANTVVKDFKGDNIKLLQRPHRFANFAVLKAPDIPSVLVEAGFMSNKREANKLATPAHRRKIAKSLKSGIDAYFKTVKENERT